MYDIYVTKIKNIRPHPNADRLNIGEAFGNGVVIDKSTTETDLYLYLPTDGQISIEYGEANNLFRKKDENGNNVGGFIDPDKRNIRAIKLRGERSDGLVMPLASLTKFGDITKLCEGDIVSTFNGHEIARKYMPAVKTVGTPNIVGTKKTKDKVSYYFPQHIDSPQLKYCLSNFKAGDVITITEKLEGTSHRSAMVLVKQKNNWWRKLLNLPEKTTYRDFCGSRRVTLQTQRERNSFYGDDNFRLTIHKTLLPYLTPNLAIFGEIVGWPSANAAPLMGTVNTKCLESKSFTQTYGENMIFHYGCAPGTYDFYIYRICELDTDGSVRLEYSTDQIALWCSHRGFKYVPILYRGVINDPNEILVLGETYADGESTLAPHWREGCVIRRDNNAAKFDVYKNKNFAYKMMKGLAVAQLDTSNLSEDIIEEM